MKKHYTAPDAEIISVIMEEDILKVDPGTGDTSGGQNPGGD